MESLGKIEKKKKKKTLGNPTLQNNISLVDFWYGICIYFRLQLDNTQNVYL